MLLLGHRGAVSSATPENTLASVDRALREGADGVEIDVRLTADGVPVCLHDPGLSRTTGEAGELADLLAADLPPGIPSLDEVLALVGNRGRLVVEMKKPAPGVEGTVEAIAAALWRHRLGDVVVSSFDRRHLRELRVLLDAHDIAEDTAGRSAGDTADVTAEESGRPRVRTALLGRPGLTLGTLLHRALTDGHDEVHPHVLSVLTRLDLARTAVEQGIGVTAWTVNRPSDLTRMAAAGIEAAICDDPRDARRCLSPSSLSNTG